MRDACAATEHLHSAWVDGELRTIERARVAAHLQRCPPCRAQLHQLRVTQAMLRSMPPRRLATPVVAPDPAPGERRGGARRLFARSAGGMAAGLAILTAAAFAAGSPQPQDRQVAIPVDVYVADHLVRTVGGPVSTPALLEPPP